MELNEDSYNRVRSVVAEKLGKYLNELVKPITMCHPNSHNHGNTNSSVWGRLRTSMLFACVCAHVLLRYLF